MSEAADFSVSVIIPTYDRAHTVEAAIRSALVQSSPPLEVIVVDDGSRDATGDVVAGIPDPGRRIRYVRQENRGVAAARNRGVDASHGDWIAFLDSDDLWLPQRLANARDAIVAEPDADFLHCEVFYREADGSIKYRTRRSATEMADPAFLLSGFTTWTPSVMVRRALLERVNPLFAEWLPTCSDFELWWRLLATARRIVFTPSADVMIRKTPGSLSDGRIDSARLKRNDAAARGSAARWMADHKIPAEYVDILRRDQYWDYRNLLRESLRCGRLSDLFGDLRSCTSEFSGSTALRALASAALADGRERLRMQRGAGAHSAGEEL